MISALLVSAALASDSGMPAINELRLPNGLTVIIVDRPLLPIVEGRLAIGNGALSDPARKEGLANIVVRMLARGAAGKDASEISSEVDNTGAAVDFFAGWETSQMVFRTRKEALPIILKLSAELFRFPDFHEDSLLDEKTALYAELQSLSDDNWKIADQWLYKALYPKSRLSMGAMGERESARNLTIDDVRGFYREYYRPDNAVLFLGGDVERRDIDLVTNIFTDWAKPKPATRSQFQGTALRSSENTIWIVDKPDMLQCQIRIGNIGIPWNHPDYYPVLVLNSLFGGGYSCLLMEELRRQRGLTYGAFSQFEFDVPNGPFFITTFTENANVREMLMLIRSLMKQVHTGRISDESVESAKKYLLGRFADQLQSPDFLGSLLIRRHWTGSPLDDVKSYFRNVRSVDPGQVREAAIHYINPDNNTIIILGRRSQIEDQVKGFPAKLRFAHYREGF